MTRIRWFLIFLLALFILDGVLDARYLKYKQTDPLDIVTRNKIDRDIDAWIEKLDRQIQTDTTLLTAAQTTDTVYLDSKYKDSDFRIFVTRYVDRGADTMYVAIPLSDSSFTITGSETDTSTVQWMTIHK